MTKNLNDEIDELVESLEKVMEIHAELVREREYENTRYAKAIEQDLYIPAKEKFRLSLKKLFTDHGT